MDLLGNTRYTSHAWSRKGFGVRADTSTRSALEVLALPGVDIDSLIPHIPSTPGSTYTSSSFAPAIKDRVGIEGRYAPYIKRQEVMAKKYQQDENLTLPADLDYSKIHGISIEERQALEQVRPVSVGMARRIEGVTPSGALQLLLHVRKNAPANRKPLPQDEADGVSEDVLHSAP